MCLYICMTVPAADRAALEAAASAAGTAGLHVEVRRASRWPWARHRPARAFVSEDGGCGCSLLSDDASWEHETWGIREDLVEPLAMTIQTLAAHVPDGATVEALWVGERCRVIQRVTPAQMGDAVRRGLGTTTRYVVTRPG